jgi:hypothetical protein
MLCNPKYKVLEKTEKKPTFKDDNEIVKFTGAIKSQALKIDLRPKASKEDKKASDKVDQEKMKDALIRERS